MNYTVFLLLASLAGYAVSGLLPFSSDSSGSSDGVAEVQVDGAEDTSETDPSLKG